MLYSINPARLMRWTEIPSSLLDMLVQNDVDLQRLEWLESDRLADDITVALALRYGIKSRDGLIISGGYVAQQNHPQDIARTHRKAAESHAAVAAANGALLEQLLPGWTDIDLAQEVLSDESAREAIVRAEAELDGLVSGKDADPDLVRHWIELGGTVPNG